MDRTNSINLSCWLNSFEKYGSELVLEKTYLSVLNDKKIQEGRQMKIWFMYGKFECRPCKNEWNSTQCSTEVTYRYNVIEKRAELIIAREFKQGCKRCNRDACPVFDQEATDKAMSKAIERIKKVMYNSAPPGNEHSDRHSQARDRRNPHDSARCEACRLGVCNYGENITRTTSSRQPSNYDNRYHGTRTEVSWALFVGNEFAMELSSPQPRRYAPDHSFNHASRDARTASATNRVESRVMPETLNRDARTASATNRVESRVMPGTLNRDVRKASATNRVESRVMPGTLNRDVRTASATNRVASNEGWNCSIQ